MRNLSLKWLVFSFFLLFGYLPLLVLSYVTISANTKSLESGTHRYVSVLLNAVTDRMEARYSRMETDLKTLSGLPSVVAFVRSGGSDSVSSPTHTMRLYLGRENDYKRIMLYSAAGVLLTAQSYETEALAFSPRLPATFGERPYYLVPDGGAGPREIVVASAIEDPDAPGDVIGYVCIGASLDGFTRPLLQANLGEEIEKTIIGTNGRVIWTKAPEKPQSNTILQKPREYKAYMPDLGWTLLFTFPENAILGEVNRQLIENLVFIGVVALIAAVAAFEFSRRVSNHIQTILKGTDKFAEGDLDYRIAVNFGRETSQLADAFNLMATRLKEHQTELIRSNRLACMGLFSAQIAHELKNPLAGVKTSAQVLGQLVQEKSLAEPSDDGGLHLDADDLEHVQELSGGISEEIDRLNRILTGLMDFARPRPSRMFPCNLGVITDRSLRAVKSEVRKRRVTVVNQVENILVQADPDQLVQVLINLLFNSLTAVGSHQGRIVLDTSTDKAGRPVFSIIDNGVGISKENLERIFDPFFTSSRGGYGLGLSVAYTLAAQNNIQIKVESREEEGTAFHLIFLEELPTPTGID